MYELFALHLENNRIEVIIINSEDLVNSENLNISKYVRQ